MAIFKTSFPFDTELFDRLIVTEKPQGGGFTASIRLKGIAEGYGVFSSGLTPEIAAARAVECCAHAERWRKLVF